MLRVALIVILLAGCYRQVKQTEGYCYWRDGEKRCFKTAATCRAELHEVVEARPWTEIEGECKLSFP